MCHINRLQTCILSLGILCAALLGGSISQAAAATPQDSATREYVDSANPFAWEQGYGEVTLKRLNDWLGIGVQVPLAPFHVGLSSWDGMIARFSPGGVFGDYWQRSFIRIDNQNPFFGWELSLQDENGTGVSNGFALCATDPSREDGLAKPRLFINPGGALDGKNTARSYMTLYNQNVSYAWQLSIEDPEGKGTLNGFAVREQTPDGLQKPAIYVAPATGAVGIGTSDTSSGAKLTVNGRIRAEAIVVDTKWADYVFANTYSLMPLSNVEELIKKEKHLPGVPSAEEVAAGGISIGEMQTTLLAKVEELTLRLIEQDKRVAEQELRIQKLESDNFRLRTVPRNR